VHEDDGLPAGGVGGVDLGHLVVGEGHLELLDARERGVSSTLVTSPGPGISHLT
jgi:hypothetical protein